MISYAKSIRSHVLWRLSAAAVASVALSAVAAPAPILPGPNGNPVIVEAKRAGNTWTWEPAGPSQSKGVAYAGSVSDATPKIVQQQALPYQHKGGDSARVTTESAIDGQAFGNAAGTAAAAAAGALLVSGNPYVAVSALACSVFCAPLVAALTDMGIKAFERNSAGDVVAKKESASTPEPPKPFYPGPLFGTYDGFTYSVGSSGIFNSKEAACAHLYPAGDTAVGWFDASEGVCYGATSTNPKRFGPFGLSQNNPAPGNSCNVGDYVDLNGVCSPTAPGTETEVTEENLKGMFADRVGNAMGWSPTMASLAAALVAGGHSFVMRGSDIRVLGPDSVPISTETSSTPTTVKQGTTEEVPPGYSGATDPATKQVTKTTTGENTYQDNKMTTETKTTTITNITNNVTNITNTTTETKTSDEKPKDDRSECEKNPNSLACAELDSPDGDIPKITKEIGFSYTNPFGLGHCPADVYYTIHGKSYKVIDWARDCDFLVTYVKPVMLAAAFMAALMIVAGGLRE